MSPRSVLRSFGRCSRESPSDRTRRAGRRGARVPPLRRSARRRRDLQDVTVRVAQIDRPQAAALEDVRALDVAGPQVLAPCLELVPRGDREGEMMGRADAGPPGLERRVLHERDEHAAVPGMAEPEVARVGIVVVATLAQKGEAEDVAVEDRRAVEVGADRGDVMQAGEARALRRLWRGARLVGQLAHTRNPIPPVRAWNARRKTKNASE